jgi:hypothetical protein
MEYAFNMLFSKRKLDVVNFAFRASLQISWRMVGSPYGKWHFSSSVDSA